MVPESRTCRCKRRISILHSTVPVQLIARARAPFAAYRVFIRVNNNSFRRESFYGDFTHKTRNKIVRTRWDSERKTCYMYQTERVNDDGLLILCESSVSRVLTVYPKHRRRLDDNQYRGHCVHNYRCSNSKTINTIFVFVRQKTRARARAYTHVVNEFSVKTHTHTHGRVLI